MSLTLAEELELFRLLQEQDRRTSGRKFFSYYPETGQLSRHAYKKHMEFFAAGAKYFERGSIAANRVGKTTKGAYEVTCHLTGLYPKWWEGRRFVTPGDWWAASDTSETTRDIMQLELMGKFENLGTGMIPRDLIVGEPTRRRGIADAIDTVLVRHVSGGVSSLQFKSYDQGRTKFQGTKKQGIWLDEEPGDPGVYTESLTRVTATIPGETDGLMLCTFTPLMGMSAVVLMFMNEPNPNRFVLTMGHDDAPHLSEETKAKLLASYLPHERDARTKGIPALGAGAIYPVPESDILVDDFAIPPHWLHGFGMDIGWNRTSIGFHAYDREKDIVYRIREHYRAHAEPAIHAQAVRDAGLWIPGVIDPAARGRKQDDGLKLIDIYKELGLDLEPANNAVEAGIYELWQRMVTGRYKVFRSCQNWVKEFRLYRRNEKGQIVKENDHAMDDSRYFVMSGLERAKPRPAENASSIHQQLLSGASAFSG